MGQGEFSLIEKYFASRAQSGNTHTALGIGDDASVIDVPPGQQLVVTLDTLVAGRHFPLQTRPRDIAYKSLAVNVSDLVAMAATPAFFLLSLTLPQQDDAFLSDFSDGLFEAADEFAISLVGGDTCKGPLSISIQASGFVSKNGFIRRSGARVGDRIVVSGKLGAAALGLASLQHKVQLTAEQQRFCVQALNRPRPRLDLLDLLSGFASSAIDLSDGLAGDLGHILQQSKVGAIIDKQRLPVFEGLFEHNRFDDALCGGDDYQILFTVDENRLGELMRTAQSRQLDLYEIGEITPQGYRLKDGAVSIDLTSYRGYDHFAT